MKLCRVALMAKAPEPGLAKTRLVPALGDAGAAALAARLLAHALQQALEAQPDSVTLWTAPDASHPAFVRASWLGVVLAVQPEGDLGQRMARVFEAGFAQGDTPVLLMGTDAPTLGASVLQAAAAELERHDVVFVPAHDGGYALVGLRAPPTRRLSELLAALFSGMRWSTPQVMSDTRARLAAAGFSHAELPPVHDIDEPADLVHLPPGLLPATDRPATA